MKLVAAALTLAVASLLGLAVFTGTTPTPATVVGNCGGEIAVILDTIRTLESGGDYTAQAAGSSASGAYQMIDTVWRHWVATAGQPNPWAHARQAPPAVQDAAASAAVRDILDRYHDIAAVPLAWYLPATLHHPELLDRVPQAGNTLTPRQYQTRWLNTYQQQHGTTTTVCSASTDSEWALPFPAAIIDAHPERLGAAHHDYPAIDLPAPTGTPVYAIHTGTVTHTTNQTSNCYPDAATCTDKCGLGITIHDATGTTYSYCHANHLGVTVGQHVTAGQQIMTSGNTGHSSGPHLHLGIRVNGTSRCPQPLLSALHNHTTPPNPRTLPTTGCTT